MVLSEKLKIYRESSGLSQTAVAEKLNISRQSVSKWENGRGYPDIDNLVLLSEIYKVSIDDLLQENQQLKKQIEQNNLAINDKKRKLRFIQKKTFEHKDEGLLLILLAGIASFIFPLGIILCGFIFWRNKKTNSFYKLVYVISVIALGFNIYSGYVHLANVMDWGAVTIEKIE
ncbi:helix-turn-helix domain-containing protein [Enterococcus sp. LJL90]